MATLEDYKALKEFLLNDDFIKNNVYGIVSEYSRYDIKFNLNDVEYDLATDWDSVIHRFNEDKPQYWYWQFDGRDEYAIYIEGYYDSWSGSDINGSFEVGKIGQIVKTYITFKRVD